MKKKLNFICSILFAFLFVLGFGFFEVKTLNDASALDSVQITFKLNGGTCEGNPNDFVLFTNSEGKLDEFPIAEQDGYLFKGWYITGQSEPISADKVYTTGVTLSARWAEKTFCYEISNNANKVSVVALTNSTQTDGFTYNLGKFDTIGQAINAIKTDSVSAEEAITLNFVSYAHNEATAIAIDMANVIVTGEITGLQETPVFYLEATQNNSVFNFDNLTITNNQESILILPIQTTNSASIIINDCTFNSTTDDSYAIWFDTNKYAITITGNNSHSTEFLFNYIEDLNMDISEVLENSTSTPLYASIDYTFGGKTLTDKFTWTNSDRFKFVANADYYSISPQIIGNVYTVFSFFNFSFNPNGGTYASGYTIPTFNYSNTTATEFPTNNNVTKRYSFLQSWLGKFVIDSTLANSLGLETNTWYYDANAIAEFKTQNYDLTKIANYFKTSVDDFVNPTGFSSYAYDENNPFLPIEMCAKFETTPIFIAKWELINYTITFDSMGGSLVDEISKPYGETIVQPVTPTNV